MSTATRLKRLSKLEQERAERLPLSDLLTVGRAVLEMVLEEAGPEAAARVTHRWCDLLEQHRPGWKRP